MAPLARPNRRSYGYVIVFAIVLTLATIGVSFGWHALHASGVPDPYQQLLFQDEFNGTQLDSNKWVTCYDNYSVEFQGCSNYGNWEGEWYKASQVQVADGNLQLIATKQPTRADSGHGYVKTYPYVSGMVSTGNLSKSTPAKWGATYGYYEARMLIPSGQGVWPAFWLLPTDTTWPPEIDMMEEIGSAPKQILTTYFWPGPGGGSAKDSGTYTAAQPLSDAWHTYAVDWQPGHLTWYLDGVAIRSVASPHVSEKPMHMVLDLAVGGLLPGMPDKTTPDSLELLVDYVRVYQHKPTVGR